MGGAAEEGERWPFVCDGEGLEGSGGVAVFSRAFWRRARVLGDRLRARARFSREESEVEDVESESGSDISEMEGGEGRFLAVERIMGSK